MPKTTLDALREARELISERKHWTTGRLARDKHGDGCVLFSTNAVAFCAEGAIALVTDALPLGAFGDAMSGLSVAFDYDVASFNDTHSHAEVLAGYDKAIATEEAKT